MEPCFDRLVALGTVNDFKINDIVVSNACLNNFITEDYLKASLAVY